MTVDGQTGKSSVGGAGLGTASICPASSADRRSAPGAGWPRRAAGPGRASRFEAALHRYLGVDLRGRADRRAARIRAARPRSSPVETHGSRLRQVCRTDTRRRPCGPAQAVSAGQSRGCRHGCASSPDRGAMTARTVLPMTARARHGGARVGSLEDSIPRVQTRIGPPRRGGPILRRYCFGRRTDEVRRSVTLRTTFGTPLNVRTPTMTATAPGF